MAHERDLAWFAGFWDGEGSVGLNKKESTYVLIVQCSHTDKKTIEHVFELMKEWGIRGRGYTYQEKKPDKHRPSHHVRISGIANILKLGELVLPYAVTKRRNWEIAIDWAKERIRVSGGVNDKGHLLRGKQYQTRLYTEEEHATYRELAALNGRGPRESDSKDFGKVNFEQYRI